MKNKIGNGTTIVSLEAIQELLKGRKPTDSIAIGKGAKASNGSIAIGDGAKAGED